MVLVVPEQSQRPYRFGMTLLCVGALFNWLGLADTYSDPVPAIRYIGVGLIAAGASLICMAMCFWMRNIHDPNISDEFEIPNDSIHVITVDPSLEKPPEYSTVVDVPPCYEEAIKLTRSTLPAVAVHTTKSPSVTATVPAQLTVPNFQQQQQIYLRNNDTRLGRRYSTAPTVVVVEDTVDSRGRRHSEKCESSSNSSSRNTENAFAKVIRKSIRGIRRLRSGSADEESLSNGNTVINTNTTNVNNNFQLSTTTTTTTTTSSTNATDGSSNGNGDQIAHNIAIGNVVAASVTDRSVSVCDETAATTPKNER